MKEIINTAELKYRHNSRCHKILSNTVVISSRISSGIISGSVDCSFGRKKWKILILEQNGGWIVHSISGSGEDEFSFEVDTSNQYVVKFICQKGCCLNLDSTCQKYIARICFKQI